MTRTNSKKILIPAALAITLVVATFFVYTTSNRNSNTPTTPTQTDTSDASPTEQEQKAGDEQKQIISTQEENIAKQPSGLKEATVVITDAGQYGQSVEVRAFVSNIYENGTCMITVKNGGTVITKDTPAYKDATTTQCTNPMILRSEFPNGGDWYVKVHFSSASSSGESESKLITLQ